MFRQRLALQGAALGGVLVAAMVMQAVASLYLVHRDGIRWSVGQLTTCELQVPGALRAVIEQERHGRIAADAVTRLIADIDFGHRSAIARATQRMIWLWLVPQALTPDQMFGLYVRSWPHAAGRGFCDVSLIHLRRSFHSLTPEELRALLAEESRSPE